MMKSNDYLARLRRASILPLLVASALAVAQEPPSSCNSGDTDGDGAPDCVEVQENLNPSVKDNDVFNNSRLFAMQQYRDFYNREGDASGIEFWSSSIAKSTASRAETIDQFMNSAEFDANASAVARLYFAFFQRVPDYEGLSFWINYAKSGNSMTTIAEAFTESSEFNAMYAGMSNREFVERAYQNVLARNGDAEGVGFWTAQLDSGSMNRGQFMLAFTDQPEYRELSRNETFVTLAYAGMLRRTPDPEGFSWWLSYLDNGNSTVSFINQVLEAQEYRNRFLAEAPAQQGGA